MSGPSGVAPKDTRTTSTSVPGPDGAVRDGDKTTSPAGDGAIMTTADPEREKRAARFDRKQKKGGETDAGRKADGLRTVGASGRVDLPKLVAQPMDIVGQVKDGTLKLRVPLAAGAKIGKVTVRKDVPGGTFAVVDVGIKNGKVDTKKTAVKFEDGAGKEVTLDGPLGLDLKQIYIQDHEIRADVPCFIKPNITSEILGADKVPENVDDFMRKLMNRACVPNNLELHSGGVFADAGDAPESYQPVVSPIGTPSARLSDASAGAKCPDPSAKTDAESQLAAAMDLAHATLKLQGTLKAASADAGRKNDGVLRFGEGAVLALDEGTKVECEGPLNDVKVKVDARVKSMQLAAKGTALRSGQGRVNLEVSIKSDVAGNDGVKTVALAIGVPEPLNDVVFETPAADGKHILRIKQIGRGDDGAKPWTINYAAETGASAASLHAELPGLSLAGVTGNLKLKGADGEPGELRLGDAGGGKVQPTDFKADVVVDSASSLVRISQGELKNVTAALSPVALVDSTAFGFKSSGQLSGGGNLFFESKRGDDGLLGSELKLAAASGQRWVLKTDVAEARVNASLSAGKVNAHITPDTTGEVALDHLEISRRDPPIFHGDAKFQVTVGALRLATEGGHSIKIKNGTTGTITVSEMGWARGKDGKPERSPTLAAKLSLKLGADAALKPGEIPGLQGARVSVDTKTGDTLLDLDATIDKDGNVKSVANLELKAFSIKTLTAKGGMPKLAEVDVAEQAPLKKESAPDLIKMRAPGPRRGKGAKPPAAAELKAPALPTLSPDFADIIASLDAASIKVETPVTIIPKSFDFTENVDMKVYTDKRGLEGTIRVTSKTGPLVANLVVEGGKIQAAKSQILVSAPSGGKPGNATPLTAEVKATYHLPVAPGSVSVPVTVTASKLGLTDNGDGTARLDGDVKVDWSAFTSADKVLSADQRKWLNDLVSRKLLDELSAIVGGPAVPLKATLLAKKLQVAASGPGELAKGLKFSVADARFTGAEIKLGGGQSLKLQPGSSLTVKGGVDDYTISGKAVLGAMSLGGPELNAKLERGSANVNIHVVTPKGGGASIVTVDISELEATGFSAATRLGAATTKVENGQVKGAKIQITSGGYKPRFFVDLPAVKAEIKTSGTASVKGDSGGAKNITATVDGSIRFDDGKLSGDLKEVHLVAAGLNFSAADAAGPTSGTMKLDGAASISFDGKGELSVKPLGSKGFVFDADLSPPDGNRYVLKHTTAKAVTLHTGTATTVRLTDVDGEFDCVAKLPETEKGHPPPILDMRRSKVKGSVIISADGLETVGKLSMSEVDASLASLVLLGSAQTRLDVKQADFGGSGTLEVTPAKGWVIEGNSVDVEGERRSSLKAKSRAKSVRFATDGPEIHVDLKEDAAATFDWWRASFGGSSPASADIGRGRVSGVVKAGSVTVGDDKSMLKAISLKEDTLVDIDLGYLKTGTYAGAGTTSSAVDMTLRLEGQFGDENRDLKDGGLEMQKLDVAGRFRMVLKALVDGRGNFSASSHTILDGKISASGSVKIDGLKAWQDFKTPPAAAGK